jgi:hypothetical protein
VVAGLESAYCISTRSPTPSTALQAIGRDS